MPRPRTSSGAEDPMATLSRMALNLRFDDLPVPVVFRAKQCVLDTIAVIIGGSAMDGVGTIADMVMVKGGRPESVIPFYGGVVPAAEAALAIGPMARAMDNGDLHEEAGHVSEYIVSTLLAAVGLCESPVSGKEFLAAVVAGQETLIRIGMAYRLISEGVKRGYSGGHYIFGAVAAVGRLLDLSQSELENAQGIARTMTQPGTMAIYAPATLMVRVHHGLVGHSAITACLLARAGISGPREQVLLGQQGYLNSVPWQTDPAVLTRDLGSTWELERIATKGYSACYFSHSSIEGVLEQMHVHSFGSDEIASIHVEVSSPAWQSVCEPHLLRWRPRNEAECQFSLPYVVATAVLNGTVFLDAYTDAAMGREDVRNLMMRITASEDAELPDWSARVVTRLTNGSEVSGRYDFVRGHPENPFTENDLLEKLRRCAPYAAVPLEEGAVERLARDILSLEDFDDVILPLLHPLTPGVTDVSVSQ